MYTLIKDKKKKTPKPKVVSKNLLEERARKMRNEVNRLEQIAIDILNANEIPYKHQVICGFYILDIVIPSKCLIVEIDGSSHLNRVHKDEIRDILCNKWGLNVLRLLEEDLPSMMSHIEQFPDMIRGAELTNKALNEANRCREAANAARAKKKKIKGTRKRK